MIRLNLAVNSLQDTKSALLNTLSDSLERLVPLVNFLHAWEALSNISQWVVRTVHKGYRPQFGSSRVSWKQWWAPKTGYGARSSVSSEGHRSQSSPERNIGFYSRCFIVPKKDGGLRPIIDLRQLNSSSRC